MQPEALVLQDMPKEPTSGTSALRAAGFVDLTQEVRLADLPTSGKFPEWLAGALLRTAPCQYDLGRQTVSHWFDGLAMLHKFGFANGHVFYTNRFLESDDFKGAREKGGLAIGGFATDPCASLFQRIITKFSNKILDNCNVNISSFAGTPVALTETRMPVCFDPETLETLAHYRIDPGIKGVVSTAHPHHDIERKRAFSYVLDFGRKSHYRLFAIDDASDGAQTLVAELAVDRPAYMHSIGMSRRHLLFAEFPLVVNPLSFLLRDQPFIRNYKWQPERGLRFHVFEKDGGRRVVTLETEAAFAFHHVNAYESGDELIVDLVAYPDANIIDQFYLSHLRSGEPIDGAGRLVRYFIPLTSSGKVRSETISDARMELPRIDYTRVAGRPYRVVYGAGNHRRGNFMDSIAKVDVVNGQTLEWWEDGTYPGEPVFVANPDGGAEDTGVLLSVVLDARRSRSFLLVLDAASLVEVARAECPHHIPLGFHGNFFSDAKAGASSEQ